MEDALSDSIEIEEEDPSHSLIGLVLNGRFNAIHRVLILPNRSIAEIVVGEAHEFAIDAEKLALCAQLVVIVRVVRDDEDIAITHRRTKGLCQNKRVSR